MNEKSKTNGKRKKIKKPTDEELFLLLEVLTPQQIARAYEVETKTARNWIKKAKQRRRREQNGDELIQEMIELEDNLQQPANNVGPVDLTAVYSATCGLNDKYNFASDVAPEDEIVECEREVLEKSAAAMVSLDDNLNIVACIISRDKIRLISCDDRKDNVVEYSIATSNDSIATIGAMCRELNADGYVLFIEEEKNRFRVDVPVDPAAIALA